MRNHRFTTIMAIAASVTMLQSCTKVAEKLHFNLKMQTGSVNLTIPKTDYTTGSMTFGPATSHYNVDSFILAQTGNALSSKNISSVKLISVKLVLSDATADNNIRNMESCSASFSSTTYTVPYEVSVPNIPDVYAASLDIPVDATAELKSYIGTDFIYSVTTKLRRATTADLHATVEYAFNVEVNG